VLRGTRGEKTMKTKKASTEASTKMPRSMPSAGRDPKGGLTAVGREFYRLRDGANLKPGVTGPADTPEKMRRKGSFLVRMFTSPRGPMVKDGKPTRLALSANAWGEPVPKTVDEAYALGVEGKKLLERYRAAKKEGAKITGSKPKRSGVRK